VTVDTIITWTPIDQNKASACHTSRDIDIHFNKRKKPLIIKPPTPNLPSPLPITMFAKRFHILLTLAVAVLGVSAQAGLDTCILTCLSNAEQASGSCTDLCLSLLVAFFCL
jgi:hypothetical protein